MVKDRIAAVMLKERAVAAKLMERIAAVMLKERAVATKLMERISPPQ
jgi:hypothetical protein